MFEEIKTETQIKKVLSTMTILVDTREKVGKNDHILNFFDKKEIPWRREKLDYGDYAPLIPTNEKFGITEDINLSNEIIVERKKNLTELSGNFTTGGGKRLYTELSKAPSRKVLLIENSSYADLVTGNYGTQLEPKSFWALTLTAWHKYNIPIFFMPNPRYSGQFIYGYFYYYLRDKLKENAKHLKVEENFTEEK